MTKTEQRKKPVTREQYQAVIDEIIHYTAVLPRSRRSGAIKHEIIAILRKYRLWDAKEIKKMLSDEPMIELENGEMIPTGEDQKHD